MIDILVASHLDYLANTKKVFSDAWDKNMLVSGMEKGGLRGFVYTENGKNLGYITYSFSFETADIECVFVEKEHRGKGIAKSLIEKAISDLKEKGVSKILLEVRSSNERAKALYKRAGFNEISKRKNYYDGIEDALIFLKEI